VPRRGGLLQHPLRRRRPDQNTPPPTTAPTPPPRLRVAVPPPSRSCPAGTNRLCAGGGGCAAAIVPPPAQQDVGAFFRPIGGSQCTAHATRSAEGSRHSRASAKESSRNPPEAALREGQLAGRTSRGQHCCTRVVPIFWTGAPGIRTNESNSTIRLYPKSNEYMIQIKH